MGSSWMVLCQTHEFICRLSKTKLAKITIVWRYWIRLWRPILMWINHEMMMWLFNKIDKEKTHNDCLKCCPKWNYHLQQKSGKLHCQLYFIDLYSHCALKTGTTTRISISKYLQVVNDGTHQDIKYSSARPFSARFGSCKSGTICLLANCRNNLNLWAARYLLVHIPRLWDTIRTPHFDDSPSLLYDYSANVGYFGVGWSNDPMMLCFQVAWQRHFWAPESFGRTCWGPYHLVISHMENWKQWHKVNFFDRENAFHISL